MSVLLDEDTIVLEDLGIEPQCEYEDGATHTATLTLICRGCGSSALLCDEHLAAFRDWLDSSAVLATALGCRTQVECRACDRTAQTLEDLARVVPL